MSDVSAPRSAADRLLLDRRLKKRRQESSDGAAATSIPRRGDDGPAPLSFAQERLWFLERLQPGTAVYNIPAVVELDGPLDVAALGAALSAVVERQESLRTRIETAEAVGEDGVERLRGRQRVLAAAPVTLPAVDLSALPRPAATAEARRVQRREARQPFRLEGGELARWSLVRLGGEEHLLLVTLHHAIADGWSFAILLQQTSAAYAAALGGSDPASAIPPLPVSYADFAVWQRGVLQGDELERQLAYWRRRLDGAPTRLELPTNRPRPAISGHRGGRVEVSFDEATAAGIERLASELSATPFMVLLAAWQVLLGRLAGQRDVVVGTPIANRSRVETEGMIGFFANTLAVRGDFSDDPRFAELVTRVRDQTLDDFAHQDLPFEELVAELGVERSLAHAPIFQTLFALQNAPRGNPRTAGVAWRPRSAHSATAKVDLSLTLLPAEGRYGGSVEYRRDLFDETTVLRWVRSFRTLIAAAVAEPRTRVTELPLLGTIERQRLIREWNDTARPFPQRTLADLFRDAAAADPRAVALAWETGDGGVGEATYAELDAASDRGARRLVAAGVVPGDAVAVAGERSPQLVEAILSVVKAGAFYVPLDASYPEDRLVFMLEDTAAKVLLADDAAAARLPTGGPPRLPLVAAQGDDLPDLPDLPLPRGLDPAHLAYAIYTSGSTGRPKGVAVDHRAVARLLFDSGFADLGPEQTWMLFAPISFDVSTLELWAPLVGGGRLAVLPPGRLSVRQIGESIRRLGVTSAWFTAGLFHQVVEVDVSALAPLEQLLAGGDVLSPTAVGRVLAELPGTAMINGYGPTENTTFTACHRAGPSDGDGSVPIGRPIGNSTVHLLDGRLEPVPAGVAGELYTGGCGVARGYLGRPALTAAVFVPDPHGEPGSRRYRTGDLARWRADGTLEFLGRADQQVKIRGFRVEPGEVETVLRRAPMLTGAAVAVHGRGAADKRLVGYCVAAEGEEESAGAVRAWLAERLPDFLLPAQLVFLDALPLNANGKVDRRALPEPEAGDREGEHEPPVGEAEESLAALWVEVLALGDEEPVGRGDSFFRLGGHSLRATMLVARLERRLGVDVPVRLVFEHPHLADMAAALERLAADETGSGVDEPRLTAAAAE
ncbi:MAG TPA: amino acid adenylation domain-containing protein, partial [Thermoanaerobaculia bacterium]|nr:amino acid adenylation domain-containing protein [Thermoanaerobaculia bacterium]